MALVPFVFADETGAIPLSQLDANFANVKAFAITAGNVTGNTQANITALGNLTSLTVSGNVEVSGAISVVGNITTTSVISANVLLASTGNIGIPSGVTVANIVNNRAETVFFAGSASNVFIANVNSTTSVAGNLSAGGNVTGGNLRTSGTITATGNITGGNLATSGTITATGNITGGNLATSGTITATGNITGGNIRTVGLISATGNITGNFIFGNGSQLTGLPAAYNNSDVANLLASGTVSTNILTTALISATGNVTGGNLTTSGTITATGNVTGANILTTGIVSLGGNLIASGNTALSGNATAVTAANGTNTTQIATTAFVTNTAQNLLPSGVIVMWSGSILSVPTGWALCDGGNGTPNLRDRFVVGAGSSYAVAATGGSANAVVVSHTHTATSNVSDPGHNHADGNYNRLLQVTGTQTASTVNSDPGEPNLTSSGNIQSNTTGITVTTTISSTGSSALNANLPPYYALAYIMKL